MFINRKDEIQTLQKEYDRKEASFTVVYGRRRVGKTALITKFIEDKPHIYFYATQSTFDQQIENFAQQVIELSGLPYKNRLQLNSFEDALTFLCDLKPEKKLILVMDEFQNLTYLNKGFSSTLQMLWDTRLSHANIHLILCGSVISMMYSEVLDASAPLYGRRTANIHLKPIDFRYLHAFLPELSKLDLMQVYASFGAIPKYLQMYQKHLSFMENIKQNILNKDAYLYSEGHFLLSLEIKDAGNYFSIIESIAKGNRKIGAIAASLSLHSSYLPKYINKLIELDILAREVPVTEPDPRKSRLGQYRIKDKFLNFWFYYVYKNYNYLELGQIDTVVKAIEKNFNDYLVSFAFEDFLLEEILYQPLKYLDFIPQKIGRWWNGKEEIDLIAFDDKHITFIECKWQNKVNKTAELRRLIKKATQINHRNKQDTNRKENYLIYTKEDFLRDENGVYDETK